MSEKPDWEAIRAEYESGGVSLRQLAVKYGVSKSAIGNYKFREQWSEPPRRGQWTVDSGQKNVDSGHLAIIRPTPLPSPPNAVECAQLGLEALSEILKENRRTKQMDLSDHVKAASALSQYNKIIINALPDAEEDDEQYDLSGFDEEELRKYAEFQERARKKV